MLNVSINKKKQSQPFQLTHRNTWLLWCCQIINISCLAEEMSTWMLAILALCLCWQAHLINSKFSRQIDRPFSPILLFIIAVGGCIVIVINAYSLGVLLSMLHLLVFSYLLKAFEIKQRKDFYQLLLLGLFLLASALIFKQSLVFSIAIVLAIILNLVVLQQVFSPTKTLLSSTKLILVLLLMQQHLEQIRLVL